MRRAGLRIQGRRSFTLSSHGGDTDVGTRPSDLHHSRFATAKSGSKRRAVVRRRAHGVKRRTRRVNPRARGERCGRRTHGRGLLRLVGLFSLNEFFVANASEWPREFDASSASQLVMARVDRGSMHRSLRHGRMRRTADNGCRYLVMLVGGSAIAAAISSAIAMLFAPFVCFTGVRFMACKRSSGRARLAPLHESPANHNSGQTGLRMMMSCRSRISQYSSWPVSVSWCAASVAGFLRASTWRRSSISMRMCVGSRDGSSSRRSASLRLHRGTSTDHHPVACETRGMRRTILRKAGQRSAPVSLDIEAVILARLCDVVVGAIADDFAERAHGFRNKLAGRAERSRASRRRPACTRSLP